MSTRRNDQSTKRPLDKYDEDGVLTAVTLRNHRQKMGQWPTASPPHTIIFCYQPDLLAYGVKKYRGKRVDGFFGDLYLLKKKQRQIGLVGNFGVGAPVVAVLLEDFVAWGVKRFIGIGIAGGLQPDQQAGDVILINGAIRDEGTSHHYLPPDVAVVPSSTLLANFEQALEGKRLPLLRGDKRFTLGSCWTTDAPYRETPLQVARFRQAGVAAVEMETAAFLAVGMFLGVETAVSLVIGDKVSPDGWQPMTEVKRVRESSQWLLETAVALDRP